MTESITIHGMSCDGCVNSVRRALDRIGASHADVTIGKATVEYDDAKLSHRQIVEAIEDAGFEVRGEA